MSIATLVVTAGIVPLAASGLASAAPATNNYTPPSVLKSERIDAEAQVLNTTPANIQTAIKNKTLKQLVTNAGLTRATFNQKLKAQLTTDLEAKGYTPAEVTSDLGHHKHIGHIKAHLESETSKDKS